MTGSPFPHFFPFKHWKRMIKIFIVLLFVFSVTDSFSQQPASWSSGDVYQGIRKLNVLGSVLFVAAHPDDENTRLLTYFSKDKLYRTGYLSITRGDGGQNLIGDEQGIELGLIRTQELLSARRIDGAEQFFTRAFDFGYSKSPKETFTKWDKEKILSDVVWVIRKFQPDVIITRFPTTGEGGHGHHTASAILAVEAFSVAADPKRFPEQLQYVQPWQAKRILWNGFVPGGGNATGTDFFRFDVGGFNPVLGKSYGEIASESRSQHKSQGFGVARGRGEAIENFRTLGGDAPATDLFDGIESEWKRIKGGEAVSQLIQNTIASFDFMQPQKSVPQLVQLHKKLQAMPEGYWRNQKINEVKELIVAANGLWLDVFTNEAYVAQEDSFRINIVVNNRLGNSMALTSIAIDAFDSSLNKALDKNKNLVISKTLFAPAAKPLTQPYWLQENMNDGYFNVKEQQLIGQPDVQPSFIAKVTMNIEGENFVFEKPIRYKFTDPVKGELYQPFVVVPAISLRVKPEFLLGTKEIKNNVAFEVKALKNYSFRNPKFHLSSPDFNEDLDKINTASLKGLNKNAIASFETEGVGFPFVSPLSYYLKDGEKSFNKNPISIRYDHVPWIHYLKDATIPLASTRLNVLGKKIGYIIGAGDKVPEALEQMGYEVTLLTNKELSRNNLKQFDAIISGVRAYNTNEWLNSYYDKLMKYVEDGGNLIVQYNTSNQIGPVRAKIGPYNFGISRNRITDENATVTFLKPEHPVLNYPNKILADDFTGWVQERSIYHADNWDDKYESILSMSDPDEQPNVGSLIIAKHGKGFFTYTGLVFFRELPAGVPGAYRLLANLIALNKIKSS
jgi:LmbE family N-acetylglucosaminyl deacetylase